MPLSDDEQRTLDEIERELTRDDPEFAAGVNLDRYAQRPLMVATAVLFAGITVLLIGLVTTQASPAAGVITSVAGLLSMVGAVVFRVRRRHRR